MDILIKVVLPLGLAFIMFSLGLGLTFADFARVVKRPYAFLIGGLNQVILLPLIAFVVIMIFGLTAELAVGFMILAFCPGGVTSNIISRLSNGDVALSVSLTAIVSLLSMITVPLFLAWAVSHFMGTQAPAVNITRIAISMFIITALPVLVGLLIRQYAPIFAEKAAPAVTNIATGLFVIIVAAALASNWRLFVNNLPTLAPSLIALNVALLVIGYFIAKAAGLTINEVKTVAIETGIQNSTLGITVATLIAGQATGFSAYSLPSAVYGILMYLVAAPAVALFRKM